MRNTTFFILIAIVTLTSGCSGVRNLKKPDIDMPKTYANEIRDDSASVADMRWWEFYSDSLLIRVIRRTLVNNKDFLKASATVERLREEYGVSRLNLAPEINGLLQADHETNNYGGHGVKKDPEYDLKVSVAWEINLMGAMKWSRDVSKANYMASVNDLRAMQMTLIAEAASAYFNLVALDNELSIVRQTMITRKEALEKARLRYEGGLTSEIVFQQAQVEYASAAALVPDCERRITVARNALSLLMGEYPSEKMERGFLNMHDEMPEKLPAGVPSQLLTRRPDLRASENRLSAAMANVGLTYANRFPTFSISLSGGLENDRLTGFFKSPFTYALGSITGTVFDFGKKKRKYKSAIAAYDEARYSYEQAVLTAFHEVDNARDAYRHYRESAKLKIELRNAASEYVRLALLQYRAGTLSYLDVLDAQRRYFEAQLGVSNAIRDEYLSLVTLYKVLGGGWHL